MLCTASDYNSTHMRKKRNFVVEINTVLQFNAPELLFESK